MAEMTENMALCEHANEAPSGGRCWCPATCACRERMCKRALRPRRPDASELIICAGVKMPDGYVVMGHRHDGCLKYAWDMPRYRGVCLRQEDQGFVTSTGRFVGREEAYNLHFGDEGMLFSEDCW